MRKPLVKSAVPSAYLGTGATMSKTQQQTRRAASTENDDLSSSTSQASRGPLSNAQRQEQLAANRTMAVRANSDADTVTDASAEQGPPAASLRVSVPVPQDGDPDTIRDTILRGAPFCFDETDLARMAKSRPGLFWIEGPDGKRATAQDVLDFRRNPDGTTTIDMPGWLVRDILSFKTTALLEGYDADVQGMVIAALDPSDPKAQAEALRRLEAVPDTQLDSVIEALNVVAWSSVGRGSSDLQLTLARICARSVSTTMGPVDDTRRQDTRDAAEASVSNAAGIDMVTKAPQAGAKVDRALVSRRYREAAAVLRQIGDTQKADEYEYMARMYEADGKDQGLASINMPVDRWKSDGQPSMRPMDQSEIDYPKEAARMRGDAAVNYDDLLKNVPTKGVTNNTDGPGVNQVAGAKMSIPELINTGVKLLYMGFGVDAGTRAIQKFDDLKRRYDNATKVNAPPRPDQVERVKSALLAARNGASLDEIGRIDEVLAGFPRLEEAARAFWAGAKK